MENLDPMGHWLLLGVTAGIAFMIGRASAGRGGDPLARKLAEEQEIAGAVSELSSSTWEEVDRLMRDNKKIEAIKVLREATGLGLKLSKQAVEQRAAGR